MILTVWLRGENGHRLVPWHGTYLLIRGRRGRLVFICKYHIEAESGISLVGFFWYINVHVLIYWTITITYSVHLGFSWFVLIQWAMDVSNAIY